MGDTTAISWTDHTWNPWWGCTKIAPGCDNCYAAALDKRTGGDYWDVHTKPRRTSEAYWNLPHRWNRKAEKEGHRRKVFCGSMMDWCDKDAPPMAREFLWSAIKSTPWLDWQLLTKRASLIRQNLPYDWGDGYDNVWLGVTVENRQHGLPRIEELRRIPAKVRFLSCEPLLEHINIKPRRLEGIHWVIIGGESGPGCRPMIRDWVIDIMDDCHFADVPVFFKQWGGNKAGKGGDLFDGREIKEWPLLGREAS